MMPKLATVSLVTVGRAVPALHVPNGKRLGSRTPFRSQPMPPIDRLPPVLAAALGLGLLIGIVRERHHNHGAAVAGTRTHALLAIAGAVAALLGGAVLIAVMLAVAALAASSHWRTAADDPGLTGEVAMLATTLLGGLAARAPAVAAGLGVLVAILLYAKQPLQRFSRELLSAREIEDALMLAAAALVVMPLLPAEAVDPWGVLRLPTLWRIVVLVMAVGLAGHVAMRAVGARRGLPLAGFLSGFASSTATVAGFGARVRRDAALLAPAASAALLANLSSLLLMAVILGTASPPLLVRLLVPLAAAALVLLLAALAGLRSGNRTACAPSALTPHEERAVKPVQAVLLALMIGGVLLLSAWLRGLFGASGVVVAAALVALAELHAAAASLGQLVAAGDLDAVTTDHAVIAILGSSALAKSTLAFASGGRAYGLRVAAGLALMVIAAEVVLLVER